MHHAILCLILSALLAGCGQKGPLRIPQQATATQQQAETQQQDDAQRQ